jgi:hypothetical protein
MAIEIKEVLNRNELKKFIKFQNKLYENNKYYVPALVFDELNTLQKEKNPAFDYCTAKYWLAYKDGNIVGRIAGIINNSYIEKWGNKYVRFGWVDFIEDEEVSKALFATLENWAKENGMTGIHGPLGFTDLDKEGMLVEGFDEMGNMTTYYNSPYYPQHLEKMGYKKDVDWLQYIINVPQTPPQRVADYAKRVLEKYNLRILKTRKAKDLLPYADDMFALLNDAYEELYGVVPLNDKQIKSYVKQYFGFIEHEYVCFILDENDKIAAFAISMPTLAKALQKSKGNLFPFGFIHIMRAMKKNDSLDLFLIGIKPSLQAKGVHTVIFNYITEACIRHNVKVGVAYPQLENNKKVNALWKYYDVRQNVRRRCFFKPLES